MTNFPENPAETAAQSLDFHRIDLRGRSLTLAELRAVVPRAKHQTMADAEQKVLDIIAAVRSRGFEALGEFALAFDGVEQSHPRVPAAALAEALENLDPSVRAALEESIRRARRFADGQRPANVDVELGDGAVGQPELGTVGRVGL
ncbi:histidinol dehydrogenase, partial [Arthrobacter sp. Hiyo1]|uniref:histidinol dehydrogenase n=1 Tax=Arthrobacter sp. Hiyo1 TaxID=1588020 RepID=UPI000AD6FFC5